MILFQYLDATDDLPGGTLENPGCTVGIQQPGCLVGLQYLFADEYAPGAADILPGRAILFTTTSIRATGSVTGTIIDAETSLPVPGVDVSLRFTEYHSVTDEQGHYLLEGVLISTYEWVASGERYNSVAISNVVVLQDSITIVNAALLHPEIQLTIDSISIMLPGDPLLVSFDVINDGNGPLDCEITVFLSSDSGEIVPWDSLFSLPVSEIVEDPQINGCEFFGGEWWITGGFGAHGGNYLYRFNPAGVLQSILPQPGSSLSGWFDLATDGQFLFGSDSAAVVGIDATGQVHEVIPSPLNPTRAIAYDPELDHFWVADLVQDLYEINRQGQVLQQFDNPDELSISGLAWHEDDPLGYKLYLFSRHGTEDLRRISRMHPLTGQIMTVVDLPAPADEHAGGCTITHEWNGSTVFAAILEHNANDVLRVYLLDSLISWLEITPEVFSVPGGAERSVLAAVDAVGLRPAIYRATLSLFNAVLDTTLRVPINLDIQAAAAPEPAPGVPAEFALYQNFPNPFNPRTEIAFDLPLASFVTLELYNTLGQRVTTLISEHRPAGRYAVSWDGSALSTGLYLYRIHAGAFVETRKMILLK